MFFKLFTSCEFESKFCSFEQKWFEIVGNLDQKTLKHSFKFCLLAANAQQVLRVQTTAFQIMNKFLMYTNFFRVIQQ